MKLCLPAFLSFAVWIAIALCVGTAIAAEPKTKSNDPWKTSWVNVPAKPLPVGVSHRTTSPTGSLTISSASTRWW